MKTLGLTMLDTDQYELLYLLREEGSVQALAKRLERDVSTVNRQLKVMSEKLEVLQKVEGYWQVSQAGSQIADHWRDFIVSQNEILNLQQEIRIVTTREFASRVLVPNLHELFGNDENIRPVVLTTEGGAEDFLLKGSSDIGIDCDLPRNPQIRYKSAARESFVFAASPEFLRQNEVSQEIGLEDLSALPAVLYTRVQGEMRLPLEPSQIAAQFNDLGAMRAAAVAGLGWMLIPGYAVCEEFRSGTLVRLALGEEPAPSNFRVSWLRERKSLSQLGARIAMWLSGKNLD